MTVKYSAFYPAASADGVKGTALPATRNVNLGDWDLIADGTTLNVGDTVQWFGSTFVVVTSHIMGPATGAPDINPNYQMYAQSGADGSTLYTWIAYADSADGLTNFTTGAPGTRIYIGIASNKTSNIESSNAADYTWSKMQGPVGPAIIITPDKAGFVYIDGALSPAAQTITYTATLSGISGTINWTTVPNIKASTGTNFTINQTEMGANSQVVVTATVGAVSQSVILPKIADPAADPTITNTAAAITGQAATATSSDFAVITGATRPEDNATRGENYFLNPVFVNNTTFWTLSGSATRVAATGTEPSHILSTVNNDSIAQNNVPISTGTRKLFISYDRKVGAGALNTQISNNFTFIRADGGIASNGASGSVVFNEFGFSNTVGTIVALYNKVPVYGVEVADRWITIILVVDVPLDAVKYNFSQIYVHDADPNNQVRVTNFTSGSTMPGADLTELNPIVGSSDVASTAGDNLIRNAQFLQNNSAGVPAFWSLQAGTTFLTYAVAGDTTKFLRMTQSGLGFIANVDIANPLVGYSRWPGGSKKLFVSARVRRADATGWYLNITLLRNGGFITALSWTTAYPTTTNVWQDFKTVMDLSAYDFDAYRIDGYPIGVTTGIDVTNIRIAQTESGANITGENTAAAIVGQAPTATSSDFSVITGATKPADNAGSVGILYPLGSHSVIAGNTVQKTLAGTHGAYEGGAVGLPQAGSLFVASSILSGVNGGGWETTLALDNDNTTYALGSMNYAARYVSSAGTGDVYLYVGGSIVGGAPVAVTGVTEASRMSLVYDGVSVAVYINGIKYKETYAAPNQILWPKILDYYRSVTLVTSPNKIYDIAHGTALLRPDINSNILDTNGSLLTLRTRAELLTILGIAASISGQGPGATAAADAVLNEYIPAGDSNRVRYSVFEGGLQGWGILNNPAGLSVTLANVVVAGRQTLRATIPFVANTQSVTVGTLGGAQEGVRIRVQPNERLSVQAKLTVTSNNVLRTWGYRVRWLDETGASISTSTVDSDPGDLATHTLISGFVTAPANAYGAALEFVISSTTGGTGGNYIIDISEAMLVGASAAQTVHPLFVPGPSNEYGADVTSIIEGPVSSTFKYDYTNTTPEAGEFPRDLQFKLATMLGYVPATWTYTVKSGTVNGFTSASGAKTMTGTTVGTFTVNSLATNTAVVVIKATYNSIVRSYEITLSREVAAPPVGGDGGGGAGTLVSKTSGFTGFSTTSFIDTTGTLNFTTPTGVTDVDLNMNLSAYRGSNGTSTVEAKFQMFIGGVWTDQGTTQSNGSSKQTLVDPPETINEPASFSYSFNKTGLTANTAYQMRVVIRCSVTAASHTVTGTVSVVDD